MNNYTYFSKRKSGLLNRFSLKSVFLIFCLLFVASCGGGSDNDTPADADNDSVIDSQDQCANTPSGASVDAQGCSSLQLDTDSDGVLNTMDQCPGTAIGISVDSVGCSIIQLDNDEDGVLNTADQCDDTPAGEAVNAEGCSESQIDTDNDGLTDNVDECPNTPNSEPVDSRGCGTQTQEGDADNDGVEDRNEPAACLMSAIGATVDANGCAASQRDTDEDGVNDDADTCPNTPTGEQTDAAGCGVVTQGGVAADADDDGVADTADDCPNTEQGQSVDENGCADSQKDTDSDGVMDSNDLCPSTPSGEQANMRGCGNVTESKFTEANGIVVIEMESTNYSAADGWILGTGIESLGSGYLEWQGGDNFNTPGMGIITIPVAITTPGTYRVIWRNAILMGDASTDSNDAWLKVEADNFFGLKISEGGGNEASAVGHVVCPAGKPATNRCDGVDPNGASGNGFLKVYRTGTPLLEWKWVTGTSDNDRHEVFATFDTAGTYNVIVSGRSDGHAIDRLVLFRDQNASDNVSVNAARSDANQESPRQ